MKHFKLFEDFNLDEKVSKRKMTASAKKAAKEFLDFCKEEGYTAVKIHKIIWASNYNGIMVELSASRTWHKTGKIAANFGLADPWEELDASADDIGFALEQEVHDLHVTGKILKETFPGITFVNDDNSIMKDDDEVEIEEDDVST